MMSVYFRRRVNWCCLSLLPASTAFTSFHRRLHSYQPTSPLFASSSDYPLGGDFAGLSATFNPIDGSFIPIPVHLVPEALVEWEQEPKCLEVLVSEDMKDNESKMERNTITVIPTTGCGVDNLETMKKKDIIDLKSMNGDENTKVVGIQYPTGDESFRLESIFGLDGGYRMRVVLDLIKSETSILFPKSPIHLVLERRTSEESSGGTRADGGGLDGRTVSELLGKELTRAKTFVEEDPLEDTFEDDGIKYVSFPGNVTISYSLESEMSWTCDVSHTKDGVVRGVTSAAIKFGDGELDFDVEAWNGET
jgi:hypothetical protein